MFFVLIAILAVASVFLWLRKKNDRLPPGPWGLPVIGYLPWLDAKAPHVSLADLSKKYGPIYGLFLGSVYTVVLTDHKVIRRVLAKDLTTGRAPLYLTHGIMKGYGIICSERELWKDQRKFVFGCLKHIGVPKISGRREKLESRIMSEVLDMINHIKAKKSSQNEIILDPADTLRHNIGSVVNQIVFGTSYNRDEAVWRKLLFLQEEGVKHVGIAGPLNFLPFLRFIPFFRKPMDFLIEGQRDTHNIYLDLINQQDKLLKEALENDNNFQPDNVLQCFLMEKQKREGDASQEYYSNQQFVHLLADLFGAGLDTTLATFRWYLLYMANYPQIQKKIQEEIDEIIIEKPNMENLGNMPYTEASLTEVLRIRSVVPTGIPHGSLEEIEIEGFRIPKNTMIVPLQWRVHMNEEVWENPEEFIPERHLDEEGRFVKREAMVPFQTGKRMCVGDDLARMILFFFAVGILKEFSISPADGKSLDTEGESGLTFSPKDFTLIFKIRPPV